MLFFLLLLAWQNMIVSFCCCCCYCCVSLIPFCLRVRLLADRTQRRKQGRKCTWAKIPINYYTVPRFWPNLFYKKHFYILARCPRLASENAPDTTDSTSHLPELKEKVDNRLYSIKETRNDNKQNSLTSCFPDEKATSRNWHSIQHTSSSKEH